MRFAFALAFVLALVGCGGSSGFTPAQQPSLPGGTLTSQPRLFVSACPNTNTGCITGGGAVFVYDPPYTGAPIATITQSIDAPRQIAVDSLNNLYVANNFNSTILAYNPPYTSFAEGFANLSSLGTVEGVQVGGPGIVISLQNATIGYFQIFQSNLPPPAWEFNGGGGPPAALDANGNVYRLSSFSGSEQFSEYAPPTFGTIRTITIPSSSFPVESLELDAQGTAYFAAGNDVIFVPASGAMKIYAPNTNGIYYATYDPSGDAIVASSNGVQIVTPQATLAQTITQGVSLTSPELSFGKLVACDASYDIFVANNNSTTVTVYQRPYTSAPTVIQLPSGYQPNNVVLGP